MYTAGQERYARGMRLVAYIRVSTTGQLDAYGPESQLADIRKWCKANGHKIVDVKTDDISGTKDAAERVALLECLEMLRNPPQADGMVFANLTRLARELHVQEAILAQIWNEGKRAFAADQGEILQDDPDDPMRTAMRQMQGVFAQLDRAMITKRLRDGRRIKGEHGGKVTGAYPYGQKSVVVGRGRDAGVHEDEQVAVTRIVALRNAGASYRTICETLTAEGIKPRRSDTWQPMSVRSVALKAGCN